MSATIRRPRSLGDLPPELVGFIAQDLKQHDKLSLYKSCHRFRQIVESLLYRNVRIHSVAASGCFQRTITQDATRASYVQRLAFAYVTEEGRADDDAWALAPLPNLESLTMDTPYADSLAWQELMTRTLNPGCSGSALGSLRRCSLVFRDSNGEFWGARHHVLGVLYLPSLEDLSLRNLECDGGLPPPSFSPSTGLRPLNSLEFLECDLDESGLQSFLQVRAVRALSITNNGDDYPLLEIGLSHFSVYLPALACSAETLESLQVLRYFERQEQPIPLATLPALRLLSIDMGDFLVSEEYIGEHDRHLWLQNVLPPNIEIIMFECFGLNDEEAEILQAMMEYKSMLVPRLRRIELLGVRTEDQELPSDLETAAEAAGVEIIVSVEEHETRWPFPYEPWPELQEVLDTLD